jgi:two-component system, LuxR family, response regulator FixJ
VDLTTYVVDDDEAARQSLTFLLRTESIRARAFASAKAFLEQLQPEDSGCIIADVRMPEMDGITLVDTLKQLGCRMPVIVMTGHADVPSAVQAMKVGASDFLEKPYERDAMLRAVRRCLEVSEGMDARQSRQVIIDQRLQTLTGRENQVYAAVVEGLSNKEVGIALNISPRTVEIHRANVMTKMKAQSLSELVRTTFTSQAI